MLKKILFVPIFALLLVGCSGEQAEKPAAEAPEGPQVTGKKMQYEAGGATLDGYLAWDKSITGKRPAVIVVHEWWGQNDYIRSRADQLAELGYAAFAIDMYGDGKYAEHPGDAQKFMMEVMENVPVAEERFKTALELLKQQDVVDADKIAAIGYCFGGAVVLHMARIGTDLDGVVSFHGNLSSMHTPEHGSVKAKVLVCHGAADPFVSAEQIEGFKAEMEAAGVDYEFIAYEGAQHAFTNPEATANGEKFELPLAYQKEADEKSWAAMKTFFGEIF